jgi:hypothetical protein
VLHTENCIDFCLLGASAIHAKQLSQLPVSPTCDFAKILSFQLSFGDPPFALSLTSKVNDIVFMLRPFARSIQVI